jgi:hypothetical protein
MPESGFDREAWIQAYHRLDASAAGFEKNDGACVDDLIHEPPTPIGRAFENGDRFGKMLLVGQQGSGKTTTLHRLGLNRALSGRYRMIPFSLFNSLNLMDIETVDILLMILLHLIQTVDVEGWAPLCREIPPVSSEVDEISDSMLPGNQSGQKGLFRYQADFEFRKRARHAVKADIEAVQERIVCLCGLFSRQTRDALTIPPRDPLFLIDDADHLGRADIERIFFRESHLLAVIPAGIIFAFPLFATRLASFSRIQGRFGAAYLRPMIEDGKGEPSLSPSSREKMGALILRRIDAGMIAEDALDFLITRSGGMAGTLLGLIRNGCMKAIRERASVLDFGMAESLVGDFGKGLERVLDSAECGRIVRAMVQGDEPRPNEGQAVHLFRHNIVLEYRTPDHEIRCAVHPGLTAVFNEIR